MRMQFNLKFIAAVSNSHLLQSYILCIFVLFRCNMFLALNRALYETSSFWAAAYMVSICIKYKYEKFETVQIKLRTGSQK